MKTYDSFSNVKHQSYLIVDHGTVIDASQGFADMAEYSTEELLYKNIKDIFNILRIGPSFDIESVDNQVGYFLFTKSLEVRFVNIEVMEEMGKQIYIINEKLNSRLASKFPYLEHLYKANKSGIAIYSASDLTLLKANETYINFLNEPFNIKENSIGRKLEDIVKGYKGSVCEDIWTRMLNTSEVFYANEIAYDKYDRGVTYWDSSIVPIFEDGKLKYFIENSSEVTDRVKNRKIMNDQNEQLRRQTNLLDLSYEAIFAWELNGGIIYWNKGAEQQYGYSSEEALGYVSHDLLKTVHPEPFDNIKSTLLKDGVWRGEIEHIKNDGNKVIVETRHQLIVDAQGKQIVLETNRDITERKMLERELKLQKERLEAIIRSMSDGLELVDNNMKITFLNQSAKDFFYNSDSKVKAGDSTKFNKYYYGIDGEEIPREDLPAFRIFNKGSYENYIVTIERPDKKIYASINGNPIYDNNGLMKEAILCIRDITEQIKQDELIKSQRNQLETIIENMSDALFIINPDGSYMYYNKRALDMAYQAEKIEKPGDSILHTKYFDMNGRRINRREMPTVRVLSGEKIDNIVIKAIRPDKTTYLSFNGCPVYNDEGNMIFAIICIRDMTEYIKRGLDLEESSIKLLKAEQEKNEALENAMEMKDEFLSLISHEFRTPLNVINTAIQAMNCICADELTDRTKKYINMIRQNTFRQLRLVNNLLDITRTDAGRIKIHKKNIDIVFLTNSIVQSVYTYASQKGVKVTCTSNITSKMIGIDDEKYERILLNLLSNAIKFTPSGKSITVKLSTIKDKINIEVKDNGIGIPEDKLEVIFDRFGQVDSSLSRQAEGAGIGLSLVKRFVEALEGNISVKSKVGKGSTFTIMLPSDKVIDDPEIASAADLMDNRLVQVATVEFSDIYM